MSFEKTLTIEFGRALGRIEAIGCPCSRSLGKPAEQFARAKQKLVFMNPSSKDDFKSNQEAQAFDFPPIHEEEVVHPAADDDEKGSAEENEPTQIKEDKERTEMVSKEALLRVTGGQL